MKIYPVSDNPYFFMLDSTSCRRCGCRDDRFPIYSHEVNDGVRTVHVCPRCGQSYFVFYSFEGVEAYREELMREYREVYG